MEALARPPWIVWPWIVWLALAAASYGRLGPRVGPAEDAAILYLYSENLADTGVVSYSAGGAPTEGATDFLWMVALAGLHRLGLASHHAALLLSAAAHLATAWVVARLARASGRVGDLRAVFWCAAFGLFLLPGFLAALAGFSALVFGLCVLGCALCFLERRPRALAALALVTCLVRPDGLAFAAPLLAAAWLLERGRRAEVARVALLLFVLPLLAYFAWRAWYFEHWLPLPFYVKSGGADAAERVRRAASLSRVAPLVGLAPLLAWSFWRLRARPLDERGRLAGAFLATVGLPMLAYSSFELTQNFGLRFQHPLLLAGLALPLAIGGEPRRATHLALAGVALLVLAPTTARCAATLLLMPLQTTPAIARELAALERGTMAVTEAGWLPYYSGWRCVDLWGLNTPECAREAPSVALLEREAPDLVALNAPARAYRELSASAPLPAELREHTWPAMTHNALLFALRGGYEALLVPFERHATADGGPSATTRALRRLDPALDLSGGAWMFFVSPRSACRDELRAILVAHGAVALPRGPTAIRRHAATAK